MEKESRSRGREEKFLVLSKTEVADASKKAQASHREDREGKKEISKEGKGRAK